MSKIVINKRVINSNSDSLYLIGEVGTNFVEISIQKEICYLDAIRELIKEASKCGLNAIKFQAYKSNTIAAKDHPGKKYFDEHYFSSKQFWMRTKEACMDVDIDLILSIFDVENMFELAPICDAIKIASTDINNKSLIEAAAIQGKPILISTGASYLTEIYTAKSWIWEKIGHSNNVAFMHCVSSYPSEASNIGAIRDMKNSNFLLNSVIGYSDHSLSMEPILEAYKIGANIIEKHFTLDKTLKGNDHEHSMVPEDVNNFWKEVEKFRDFYGKGTKDPVTEEVDEIIMGRRYPVYDDYINQGKIIQPSDIKLLKLRVPSLSDFTADRVDEIIGRTTTKEHHRDEIVRKDI